MCTGEKTNEEKWSWKKVSVPGAGHPKRRTMQKNVGGDTVNVSGDVWQNDCSKSEREGFQGVSETCTI